jgi:hypothetical protein
MRGLYKQINFTFAFPYKMFDRIIINEKNICRFILLCSLF